MDKQLIGVVNSSLDSSDIGTPVTLGLTTDGRKHMFGLVKIFQTVVLCSYVVIY